jgi:hypothetical protein
MVVVSGLAAWRHVLVPDDPREPERFVEVAGLLSGGFAGTSVNQALLASLHYGGALGSTGLGGWGGAGYRRATFAVPYTDPHVFSGAAFEGALYGDVAQDVRLEAGGELVYPASGPPKTEAVVGAGAHGQLEWRQGSVALYVRYDLLAFHARWTGGSGNELSHTFAMGVRSSFW